jgi:hypothetical protein
MNSDGSIKFTKNNISNIILSPDEIQKISDYEELLHTIIYKEKNISFPVKFLVT